MRPSMRAAVSNIAVIHEGSLSERHAKTNLTSHYTFYLHTEEQSDQENRGLRDMSVPLTAATFPLTCVSV